ncbi:hypothetical protein RND71_010226 [Anisodus tanguticus]|uniref:Uncharacterized protein n=1 Tax=Anisodus tanguticus TaxID=243964 RepID=A0AAE1VNM2_9SOLA|nr:hypothetical protein RND71_010226 [Anisodus tanguticus]
MLWWTGSILRGSKQAKRSNGEESIKFINQMYSQLSELMELPSSASSASFDPIKTCHNSTYPTQEALEGLQFR